MSPEKPDALLWMDVETTGLDTNKCSILEIGLRCTSMDASASTHASKRSSTSAGRPCSPRNCPPSTCI